MTRHRSHLKDEALQKPITLRIERRVTLGLDPNVQEPCPTEHCGLFRDRISVPMCPGAETSAFDLG
jgi:hypothetical protein